MIRRRGAPPSNGGNRCLGVEPADTAHSRFPQILHLTCGPCITGNSNHDTLRRRTRVDPQRRINTYLGERLPQILANAYDNPASRMFDVFLPGIPMDFLNANMHPPWSFIRNTDDRYGVKVISEEGSFLDWAVNEATFARRESFTRLKARVFTDLGALRRFLRALEHAVADKPVALTKAQGSCFGARASGSARPYRSPGGQAAAQGAG